ncbi:response regulator transcription factor [Tropicimonas sp. IMCC6043]|uniref:response regulator transcription factor n=1 Tax=Tropicimonas sp. IMCC6043 TaxID=2510645 RepID=UPI00101B816E|nr:response regulator [Tropicimonas sp. IMCC6043]RYH06797.1 response regulator transcription factor [Tropicimonas sp. IMCC6043]
MTQAEDGGDAVIHIVDDDRAAREGLDFLLSSLGLTVASHASAANLLERIGDTLVGCILADVRMPGMTGLELLDELGRRDCPLPVIMITGHGDVPMAVRAMRAGAMDFFEKPVNGMALVERINEALRLSRDRAAAARDRSDLMARVERLSAREAEVARGVLAGKQNKVIAADLGISQKTVEIHRHNAMDKLNASSAAELVRLLVAAGWGET